MKKALICLLMIPVILLSSCSAAGSRPAGSDTTAGTEETEPPFPKELTIAGCPLSGYRIVYAKSEFYDMHESFTTSWNFWRLIAADAAAKLYEKFGVQLPIVSDQTGEPSEHEILVGPTGRSASSYTKKLDVATYSVRVLGTSLVLGGGYDGSKYSARQKDSYVYAATFHAIDHLLEYLGGTGADSADLKDRFLLEGEQEIRTVACIGDSITEGVGSTDMNVFSYPAVLQRILWQDSMVVNLGVGGRTMRTDLDMSYEQTLQFSAACRYGDVIDYCFIMLGTNDSHFDPNFSKADDDHYLADARDIIGKVSEKNPDIQFFIFNCPAYYGTGTSGSEHVRRLQEEFVRSMEGSEFSVSFFDMNGYTAERLGPSLFPDALHPNDAGYAIMAEGVEKLISDYEKGSYTYTFPLSGNN